MAPLVSYIKIRGFFFSLPSFSWTWCRLSHYSQQVSLFSPNLVEKKREKKKKNTQMASGSSRSLMDFFKPAAAVPKPKRIKLSPSPDSAVCKTVVSSEDDTDNVNAHQKSRMELNRLVAKAKLNLKICTQKVTKAKEAESESDYVKLSELLVERTWLEEAALTGELQKPYALNLCKFLKTEMWGGPIPIYPPPQLIFNALNSTPFDNVKAVILGQDPYHGPGQAMGLSFSVPEGVKLPSSLLNIFKELNQDLGCEIPSHGNLLKWAVQVMCFVMLLLIWTEY